MAETRDISGTQTPVTNDSASPMDSAGRLWAPWRMGYVAGGTREAGCIFCNRLAALDDVESLILHRGQRAFVIMNLFPYNTGHVMIVPNAHVASPEDADVDTTLEMAELRAPVLRALRRSLSPSGFNLGLNIGAVAGAGIMDHLHEHVVPRWEGDANFMPILATTMVMPELIPVTYAKLRTELAREAGDNQVTCAVLSHDSHRVLLEGGETLPRVDTEGDEPLWRTALRTVQARGASDAEILGWAGAGRCGSGPSALLLRATSTRNGPDPGQPGWAPTARALAGPDGQIAQAALERIAGA